MLTRFSLTICFLGWQGLGCPAFVFVRRLGKTCCCRVQRAFMNDDSVDMWAHLLAIDSFPDHNSPTLTIRQTRFPHSSQIGMQTTNDASQPGVGFHGSLHLPAGVVDRLVIAPAEEGANLLQRQ